MATKVFFDPGSPDSVEIGSGNNDTDLAGAASSWSNGEFLTSTDPLTSSFPLYSGIATVTGPTSGVPVASFAGLPIRHWTPPVDRAFTLSGTVTFLVVCLESNMSANASMNARLIRYNATTGAVTILGTTARSIEMGTVAAQESFTLTPTSTSMLKGDRLGVILFADDAGTMATGFTFDILGGGSTSGQETSVSFTETFGFVLRPASNSSLYLNTTAQTGLTGPTGTTYKASLTADTLASALHTTIPAGFAARTQATVTAGGSAVSWFSEPLAAFTLTGAVRLPDLNTISPANTSTFWEIAVVSNLGVSPTIYGYGVTLGYVVGTDISVSAGQRIRITLYYDDQDDTTGMTAGTADENSGGTYRFQFSDSMYLQGSPGTTHVAKTWPYRQLVPHQAVR